MTGRPPRTVAVTIDRLVIEGIPPSAGGVAGAALSGELERLMAEQGIPATLMSGESLALPTVAASGLRPDTGAAATGRQAAAGVYRALGGRPGGNSGWSGGGR